MGSPYREPAPRERKVWLLPDTKRDRIILFGIAALFMGGLGLQALHAEDPPRGGRVTPAEVKAVVSLNKVDLRERCFAARTDVSAASTVVEVHIGPYGEVIRARAEGDSPILNQCVEKEVRTWQFPAHSVDDIVRIPIVFERS